MLAKKSDIIGKINSAYGEIFNNYTNNKATGGYSHAEGFSTTASGSRAHAEGNNTTASGTYSHAEGDSTTASGARAHAEGSATTASGSYSHAKENPDLILMGTRGKGGKRFLEGSLVKSVMTKCDVPMLFIPEGYSWRKSNEVVYATDFNEFDINTIDRIFNILKPYKPHIHVIHFIENDEGPKEAVLMDELEQAFLKKEFEGEIHFHLINTNNAPLALKNFCEHNDISLSSFIAYRKGFFDFMIREKINKDDFLNLNIPMLTFKEFSK